MLKTSNSRKVSYTLAPEFLVLISWLIVTVATKIKFKIFFFLPVGKPKPWLKTVRTVPMPMCNFQAVITHRNLGSGVRVICKFPVST